MSKISIINPNDVKCYVFSRAKTKRFPLGQSYVAAALRYAGHDIQIVDGSADDLSEDEIIEKILTFKPNFVGIGGTTPLYSQMSSLSKKIKKILPNVVIIFGGPHVSALPIPSLDTSAADFICIGEAEESVVAIVESINKNTNINDIPGIAFKSNTGSVVTKKYRLRSTQNSQTTIKAVDLNKCPIPARDLYDYKKYYDFARDIKTPQTQAMFTRGCPGKCAFCGAANTLVRYRNLDNVIEELKQIQLMNIENLMVTDDTYTNNKKRVIELSNRIISEGIKLNISVQLRLDQVDKEICDLMYKSGVRYVGPGIESGSPRIMKAIGKGPKESIEHIKEKMKLLKEYDWSVRCSYVFGMIGETEDDILQTIEFAKELNATENAFSILTPYPDSPLWDIALKNGQVDEYMDFDRFLYYHTIGCNLSDVPDKKLIELHELAYSTVKSTTYTLHTEIYDKK